MDPRSVLQTFPDQFRSQTFPTATAVTGYLKKRYAGPDRGDAWVADVDGKVIIMNSRENWSNEQTFEVPMQGKVRKISGRIGVNAYLLASDAPEGFRLHLNGRAGQDQSVELLILMKPGEIAVTPQRALTTSSWDSTNRRLVLEFLLVGEAVTVGVKF